MALSQPPSSQADFVEIARREGLLAGESAAELARESQDRGIPPSQLAMQKGLLSVTQIEIVETLLNPKSTVDGYEILGLLGHGGMGVVYRAKQISLGRIVALKTVMANPKSLPNRPSRFEHEAQTVGKLLHPHVITAYDFGRTGSRYFFAMELVEGEDLARRIGGAGPLSEFVTWSLIRQAATGLAHAAEFGVVHRDIKPANLLLVNPPTGYPLPKNVPMVKIADFGLALINDADDHTRFTTDNSAVGTPNYMAPEQLAPGDIDHRADLYALGATAYHMLAGRPPFHGLSLAQIFSQKVNGEPPSLASGCPGLSQGTLDLVRDLMARDRSQRIGSYAILLKRIDSLGTLDESTTVVCSPEQLAITTETQPGFEKTYSDIPATIPVQTNTRSKSTSVNGRVAIVGILAAVVSIAGIGWMLQSRRQPPAPPVNQALPELKPTGVAADLFDGQSLAHWSVRGGNWQTARDDEGATVLAASNGEVERQTARDALGRPIPINFFRLRFNVMLRQADAVEVSYGLAAAGSDAEVRAVLRIEPQRLSLTRLAGSQPPDIIKPAEAVKVDPNRYHEIRIERQFGDWRAYFDDRLIGTVPLSPRELPLFRLKVESGAESHLAYFADFVVEELQSPENTK